MNLDARDASPDILSLPSSPIRPFANERNRSSAKRVTRASVAAAEARRSKGYSPRGVRKSIEMAGGLRFSSPAKSIIFDTPGQAEEAGRQSPWRVRVTVEAEPRNDQSFGLANEATETILLASESHPRRRWKGAPIKPPIQPIEEGSGELEDLPDRGSSPFKAFLVKPRRFPSSPPKGNLIGPSPRRPRGKARESFLGRGTERGQRLSVAREELQDAVRDAVGSFAAEEEDPQDSDVASEAGDNAPTVGIGDLTVTENEAGDFSMVSMESLATRRELHNSIGVGTRRAEHVGEKSQFSVSHLPSSPPSHDKATPQPRTSADSGQPGSRRAISQAQQNPHVQAERAQPEEPARHSTASEAVGKPPSPTPPAIATTTTASKAVDDDVTNTTVTQQSSTITGLDANARAAQRRQVREERRQQRRQQHNTSHLSVPAPSQQDSSTVQSISRQEGETSHHYENRKTETWRDRREERRLARIARELEAEKEAERMSIESTAPPQSSHNTQAPAADAADVWYEEASRDVGDTTEQAGPPTRRRKRQETEQEDEVSDLLGGDVLPPRRAKIPRTWRRSSGADFMYSDSPEHLHPPFLSTEKQSPLQARDASTTSRRPTSNSVTDENTADEAAGVLTPDQSDGEGSHGHTRYHHDTRPDTGDKRFGETAADFTMPDAEATVMIAAANARRAYETLNLPLEQSDHNSTLTTRRASTADNNPTEISSRVDRQSTATVKSHPRRNARLKQSLDLADLLALNSSPSPRVTRTGTAAGQAIRRLNDKAAASQLLEPEKLRSAPLVASPREQARTSAGLTGILANEERVVQPNDNGESSSNEDRSRSEHTESDDGRAVNGDEHEDLNMIDAADAEDVDYLREELVSRSSRRDFANDENHGNDISQSYQEELNKDSPQKISVKFNDSLIYNSSQLQPERTYSPLFGRERPQPGHDRTPEFDDKSITPSESISTIGISNQLGQQRQAGPFEQPGFLARIFSASILPALYNLPGLNFKPTKQATNVSSRFATLPTEVTQHPYPSSQRARLRSRYGVLPSTHPWTLAHMRTLHRMHNSVFNGKRDSIIVPLRASMSYLPTVLTSLIGQPFPAQQPSLRGDPTLTIEQEDVWIIAAFFQILVNINVCGAMERGEVDMLGDEFAKDMRGNGGVERLRMVDIGLNPRLQGPKTDGEEIEVDFVAACLGRVVEVQKELEGEQE